MARIELRRREVDRGRLPKICMICGEAAQTRVRHRFGWHSPWLYLLLPAGLLPYAITAMVASKQMTVDVPVCPRHENYWSQTKKFLFFVGSFFGLCVLWAAWGFLIYLLEDALHVKPGGWICVGFLVAILLWFCSIPILQFIGTRPVEITERSITLTKVSEEFAEAVERERETRALRRQREDELDDEPPRRTRGDE
jgi:hypothetical protein